VSEQTTAQTGGNASATSVGTGSSAAGAPGAESTPPQGTPDPGKAASVAPEPANTSSDAPKADLPKVESPKIDAPKMDAPQIGAYTADTPKIDASGLSGKIMVMSPSRDHAWSDNPGPEAASTGSKSGIFGKRRATAVAAVIALAAIAGALGGALATSGFGRLAVEDTKVAANTRTLHDSISRLETEVAALRTSLEQTSKLSVTQANKASERLDKVEKAQAEPAAKIAKLSETVEKLRAAPAAAAVAAPVTAAPAATRDATASISPSIASAAPGPGTILPPPPRPELARLPTVEGWVLRDVADGGAVIEGRRGAFEVFAGDTIPGLGRVEAIRRQDGRWVVVTSKGLIVAR
jgi:hypothetical protein